MTPLTDEERDRYRLGGLKYTTPNVDSHGGTIEAFGTIPAYGQPIYALVLGRRGGGAQVHLTRRGLRAVIAACEQVLASPLDIVVVVQVEPGDRDLSAEAATSREAARLANPPPPPCPHEERNLNATGYFQCYGCDELTDSPEDGPIYECGTCGQTLFGEEGRRCGDCNRFTAKTHGASDGVCPSCEEDAVRPIAVLQCTACDDVIPAPPEEDTDGDN